MYLKRSSVTKVANILTPSNKPLIANSFGLPAGNQYSCPGATSICTKICYANKLANIRPTVRALLLHNWETLQACGDDVDKIGNLLAAIIVDFERECDRYSAPKKFRIHWDGDFYSVAYTEAWKRVIQAHPDTQFWVYTRSAFAVPILSNISNLALYFSTDSDNRETALELRNKQPNLLLAYLALTFEAGKSEMLDTLGKSGTFCPENNKVLPLVSDQGSACQRCDLCPQGRKDVLFSISKK
jgi:hypothetical protein